VGSVQCAMTRNITAIILLSFLAAQSVILVRSVIPKHFAAGSLEKSIRESSGPVWNICLGLLRHEHILFAIFDDLCLTRYL